MAISTSEFIEISRFSAEMLEIVFGRPSETNLNDIVSVTTTSQK
jgi:hypothetical protein